MCAKRVAWKYRWFVPYAKKEQKAPEGLTAYYEKFWSQRLEALRKLLEGEEDE